MLGFQGNRTLNCPANGPQGALTSCSVSPQAYAKFAGAPLKLQKLSNPWRSPSGEAMSAAPPGGSEPSLTACVFVLHQAACRP